MWSEATQLAERSDSINGAKRLHFWSEATLFGGVRGAVAPRFYRLFPVPYSSFLSIESYWNQTFKT